MCPTRTSLPSPTKLYLVGSLRNPAVPALANKLREYGFDVFDDWYAVGPEADDKWMEYEKSRGRSYREALHGYAARNAYSFDYEHLSEAAGIVLVLPAGKSGHLETGWVVGKGKPAWVYFPDGEPDRWDVMYQFIFETGGDVCFGIDELLSDLIQRYQVAPE